MQLSPQGLLTVHRLTNATVAISKNHPIYLVCGYFGLPILNGTTFSWLKDDQLLGSISSEQHNPSILPRSMTISVNPDRKSTTLAILTTTSLDVYGQYRCNISTPGQRISVTGFLARNSHYQVSILGSWTVSENSLLKLECFANYTLGNATGLENFTWFRDGQLLQQSK